jgi:hypothetical protein
LTLQSRFEHVLLEEVEVLERALFELSCLPSALSSKSRPSELALSLEGLL